MNYPLNKATKLPDGAELENKPVFRRPSSCFSVKTYSIRTKLLLNSRDKINKT